MANLNKVMLIGRLTRDPEIKTFGNGGKVANIGFAVNNRKKNKDSGQWEDVSGIIHGFIYNINKKTYTSLDAPGASATQVWGLNDAGVVAASAAEASGIESFVYCMHSTGCPGAGVAVERQQRRSGNAVPQSN